MVGDGTSPRERESLGGGHGEKSRGNVTIIATRAPTSLSPGGARREHTPVRAGVFPLALGLVGIALAGLVLGSVVEISPSSVELRLILLSIVAALPIVSAATIGRPDPLSPLTLVAGVFFLTYAMRGWSIYLDHAPGTNVSSRVSAVYDASFKDALDLALVAIVAFYAGYLWGPGAVLARSVPRPPRLLGSAKAYPAGIVCLLVGTACSAIVTFGGVEWGEEGGGALLNAPLLNSANLAYAGLVLVAASVRSAPEGDRRRRIRMILVFAVVLLLLGLLARQKATVLFTLVGVAGAWHWGVRPLRIRTLTAGACFFALLFPPMQTLRHLLEQPQTSLTAALVQLPGELHNTEASTRSVRQNSFVESYVRDSLDSFAQRLYGIDPLVLSLTLTPSLYPYLHGETYERLPASLIPRALWDDKPNLTLAYWFADRYWGRTSSADRSTQTISFAGEMYLNFGRMGVFVGMLLVGFAYRFIWVWLRSRWTAGIVAVYVTALPMMLQIEGDLVLMLRSAINRVGLLVVVLVILDVLLRVRVRDESGGSPSDPGERDLLNLAVTSRR